jgi:tetratricopeptide repeat protein 8
MSKSGRPLTGFQRPGTTARPGTTSLEGALNAPRTATSRPVTSASGRYTRLGTVGTGGRGCFLFEGGSSLTENRNTLVVFQASLASGAEKGIFIDIERMDLTKYATRPILARALFLYLVHVANDMAKAIELGLLALDQSQVLRVPHHLFPWLILICFIDEKLVVENNAWFCISATERAARCRGAVAVIAS